MNMTLANLYFQIGVLQDEVKRLREENEKLKKESEDGTLGRTDNEQTEE